MVEIALTDSLIGSNVMVSGGADGADLRWGKEAEKHGHTVVHWSFDGHRSQADKGLVRLTESHLLAADESLRKANRTLRRRFPLRTVFSTNLLRRNFYQIRWSERLYAVSVLRADGQVDGGTAWAIQMFLDRFNQQPCSCYLFDQEREHWLAWRGRWEIIEKPPRPEGIYGGVGKRKLNNAGSAAIEAVYQ